MIISIIAAIGKNRELGFQGKIPWDLPDDRRWFRDQTTNRTTIMGRRTYESIGAALTNRKKIVLTSNRAYVARDCIVVASLEAALRYYPQEEEVFIIGGAEVYRSTIQIAQRMYITEVETESDADTFFPKFERENWDLKASRHHDSDSRHKYGFTTKVYERKA